MRNLLCFVVLAVASTLTTHAHAVPLPVLHEEDFEGCTGTGYALLSGSFGGTVDDGIECGTDDGGARDFTFPFGAGNNVTGQNGTDYIALEDIDGAGFANPNAVVLSPVNITGATSLQLSFLFGAPEPASTRYETSDTMELQYKIDNGSYITVGSFRGTGAIGMAEDDNLDGTFTVPVNGLVMQRFTYDLNNRAGQGTVSGSTITVRALFSSDGAQEEMVFDDIIISGIAAAPTPVIDFSSATYQIGEDGTPIGAQVTLVRSVATAGTASIDLTFTSGTAIGDVDYDAAPISVTFAAGVTTALVDLPLEEDALDEDNETFTLGLLADGSGATAGTLNSAVVTLVDNDTAGIQVSESGLTVTEGGATDSFTVVLASEPTANVVVDVSTANQVSLVSNGSQPAASLQLTFTPGNWFTARTVTVSAVNDTVVEANPHFSALTLSVSSTDGKYNNFPLSGISIGITENDYCGDTFCNPSESTVTCPGDCGSLCGDTACNGNETTINCSTDCGSQCGDGAANGSEVCDGSNLAGQSCVTQGFDFGVLACAGNCLSFNTNACSLAIPDAGSDAGDAGSDSGTTDSGTSDSGTGGSGTSDSGTSGSGTSNPGPGDAGLLDAAATAAATSAAVVEDSGTPGGGTPDSATPGGGTPDSATPGGGTPDSAVSSAASASAVTSSGAASSSAPASSSGPGGGPIETPDGGDGGSDGGDLDGGDAYLDSGELLDSSSPATTGSAEPATSSADPDASTPNGQPDAAEPTLTASASGATPNASLTATAPKPSSSVKPRPSASAVVADPADAGDGGFVDNGQSDDGCDCRVAAHSRSDGARLFGLALLGLVLGRLRGRRKVVKDVN